MRVIWSRDARDDQQRIWLFLAGVDPAYADRLEARIEQRADGLALMPRLGRIIPGTTARRLTIADVQYVIDYSITDDAIRILGVRSTRQDSQNRDTL